MFYAEKQQVVNFLKLDAFSKWHLDMFYDKKQHIFQISFNIEDTTVKGIKISFANLIKWSEWAHLQLVTVSINLILFFLFYQYKMFNFFLQNFTLLNISVLPWIGSN
jgi:hypothetical protein